VVEDEWTEYCSERVTIVECVFNHWVNCYRVVVLSAFIFFVERKGQVKVNTWFPVRIWNTEHQSVVYVIGANQFVCIGINRTSILSPTCIEYVLDRTCSETTRVIKIRLTDARSTFTVTVFKILLSRLERSCNRNACTE